MNVKLKVRHSRGQARTVLVNWDNVSYLQQREDGTSRSVFEDANPNGEIYTEMNMTCGKILYIDSSVEEIEKIIKNES